MWSSFTSTAHDHLTNSQTKRHVKTRIMRTPQASSIQRNNRLGTEFKNNKYNKEHLFYNLLRLFFRTSIFFLSTSTFADPSSPLGFLALGEVQAAMASIPILNPPSTVWSLLAVLWVSGVWPVVSGSKEGAAFTLVDSAIATLLFCFGFIA